MVRSIPAVLLLCSLLFGQASELTITNANLALVRESRMLQLKKGRQSVRIPDIAKQLIPASVRLQDAGFSIIEQRFRYSANDLETLLEASKNKMLSIILESGETVRGVLEAYNNGRLFLRLDDGHLRSIAVSAQLQIDFETASKELMNTGPYLQWLLHSAAATKVTPKLSYLTRGLTWKAEYNAVIDEQETAISLSSWAVIDNNCGKSFPEATVKLLAGDIATASTTPQPYLQRSMAKMEADVAPGFSEQAISEFHVYKLDRPAVLGDGEQVQFRLLHHTRLDAKKQFSYNYQKSSDQVSVGFDLKNSSEKALPAGIVRLYQAADETDEFIGETRIGHTAKNAKLRLDTGKAFDLKAERKLVNRNRISKNSEKQEIEITFRNYKTSDVTIAVIEPIPGYRTVKILNSSHELQEKTAGSLQFMVPVAAEDSAVLHLELLYNW